MYGLPLNQSDQRIRSVFQSVYNRVSHIGNRFFGFSLVLQNNSLLFYPFSEIVSVSYMRDSTISSIHRKDFRYLLSVESKIRQMFLIFKTGTPELEIRN